MEGLFGRSIARQIEVDSDSRITKIRGSPLSKHSFLKNKKYSLLVIILQKFPERGLDTDEISGYFPK